jgi:hypothetical protein
MKMFSHRAAVTGLAVMLGVATTTGIPGTANAARTTTRSISVTLEDNEAITGCDQLRIRFGDERDPLPMARSEKQFVLDRASTPLLMLHPPDTAGMVLVGWDRDEYSVTACLAAGARNDASAAATLGQVTVGFDDGRLATDGPAGENWLVYLLVRVPEDAALDLLTENAPIDLRDISGRIKARTRNGPISLDRCRGTIDAAAENGPLTVRAGGGEQHLHASNGPLTITLEGERWEGGGIEARAGNGPVSLSFPDGFESGIRLEMPRHSPLRCLSESCAYEGEATADGYRRLDFGLDPPIIRITTGNGPVSIDAGVMSRHTATI